MTFPTYVEYLYILCESHFPPKTEEHQTQEEEITTKTKNNFGEIFDDIYCSNQVKFDGLPKRIRIFQKEEYQRSINQSIKQPQGV